MSIKNDKAETPEGTAEQKTPPAKNKAPITKPAKEECGFCVYLGPSIRMALQHGAVINVARSKALKANKDTIEKFPLVAELIVPGDEVATGRANIEKPGTLLYENYTQLVGQLI